MEHPDRKRLSRIGLWLARKGLKHNLVGFDLSKQNLKRAYLANANLCQASLAGADARQADLTNADLRDVDLRDTDLRDAELAGAFLRGANLSGAKGINPERSTPLLMLLDQPGIVGEKDISELVRTEEEEESAP